MRDVSIMSNSMSEDTHVGGRFHFGLEGDAQYKLGCIRAAKWGALMLKRKTKCQPLVIVHMIFCSICFVTPSNVLMGNCEVHGGCDERPSEGGGWLCGHMSSGNDAKGGRV